MLKLKELRVQNNMSQKALAEKLNICQSTLSHWENSKYDPDIDTLMKIAKIFNVSIDYLFNFSFKAPNLNDNLSDIQKQLLEIINTLPQDDVAALLDMAKRLRR